MNGKMTTIESTYAPESLQSQVTPYMHTYATLELTYPEVIVASSRGGLYAHTYAMQTHTHTLLASVLHKPGEEPPYHLPKLYHDWNDDDQL